MNENKNLKKGLGIHARRFIAYVVLILVTFACRSGGKCVRSV